MHYQNNPNLDFLAIIQMLEGNESKTRAVIVAYEKGIIDKLPDDYTPDGMKRYTIKEILYTKCFENNADLLVYTTPNVDIKLVIMAYDTGNRPDIVEYLRGLRRIKRENKKDETITLQDALLMLEDAGKFKLACDKLRELSASGNYPAEYACFLNQKATYLQMLAKTLEYDSVISNMGIDEVLKQQEMLEESLLIPKN